MGFTAVSQSHTAWVDVPCTCCGSDGWVVRLRLSLHCAPPKESGGLWLCCTSCDVSSVEQMHLYKGCVCARGQQLHVNVRCHVSCPPHVSCVWRMHTSRHSMDVMCNASLIIGAPTKQNNQVHSCRVPAVGCVDICVDYATCEAVSRVVLLS